MAANVTVPYDFVASTPAVADNVDANFTAILDWCNLNVAQLDASKTFTGIPSGPSSDPTTANQLTRKSYVDALATSPRVALRKVATQTIATATLTDISYDTEDADASSMIVVPGTTITIPSAGTYAVMLRVSLNIPTAGSAIDVIDGGGNIITSVVGTAAYPDLVASCTAYLAAASTLKTRVSQSSGSNRLITARWYVVRLMA